MRWTPQVLRRTAFRPSDPGNIKPVDVATTTLLPAAIHTNTRLPVNAPGPALSVVSRGTESSLTNEKGKKRGCGARVRRQISRYARAPRLPRVSQMQSGSYRTASTVPTIRHTRRTCKSVRFSFRLSGVGFSDFVSLSSNRQKKG